MFITRREFISNAVLSGGGLALSSTMPLGRALASDSQAYDLTLSGEVFQAPRGGSQGPAFREALDRWRKQTRAALRYDGSLYERPEFLWSQSNYSCCFLMLCDERFFDRNSNRYKVDEFLDAGERDFGGFDSVVLWHAYPRIGVDERNQFDFYREQPGGIAGLRRAVRAFRRRGVRTFIAYYFWEASTHGLHEEANGEVEVVIDLVQRLEVDGIFFDVASAGTGLPGLRYGIDEIRSGVIFEGEGVVPVESVHEHHASWAQSFHEDPLPGGLAPGVIRQKWLERRHMLHLIKRSNPDHAGELQMAWMNGTGMMVWENVFGSWMPWNARDKSFLRQMLPIQRRFSSLFNGEGWVPLVATAAEGVYASLWESNGVRLWTLVNRLWNEVSGSLLTVPSMAGHSYFDLMTGLEVPVASTGEIALTGTIPARGLGCFLSGVGANLGRDFQQFLSKQARLRQDMSSDTRTSPVDMTLVPIAPTVHPPAAPSGMVVVPAAKLVLTKSIRLRESGAYDGPGPSCRNEDWLHCFQSTPLVRREVAFRRYAIDETLVTNAQYAHFLQATRYRPRQTERFLDHWKGGGIPSGLEDHPVVYVDLDDARAYAAWVGKRLPTEEEWQYAAQGTDGRKYPWGWAMESGRCNGGESGGTTPVRKFPNGRSAFGCYDMSGNVWQWTESEHSDGRTRFCVLRGGSWFKPEGSIWYVEGGPYPVDLGAKFLMTWSGLDRCSTIGFRCVVDLEQ